MSIIDSIKYNSEQKKIKSACKKGHHSPNMESWYDSMGRLHSRCRVCGKDIIKVGEDWKGDF